MNQLLLEFNTTIEDKAVAYDSDYPEIWLKFEEYALRLINRGTKHYGAKAIFEVIRYHTKINTNEEFKINNNYTAYYARKFHKQYPQYDGFFETRKIKK